MTAAVPEALVAWIEGATGSRVVSAKPGGDGASRQAFAVDVEGPAGREALFCLRDAAGGTGGSAKDAAVLRALANSSIPVPRVRAESSELAALLLERVTGRSDFPAVDREEEREPTARDLMRLTARLHALDPATLDIPHLGRPAVGLDPARAQLENLGGLLATLGDEVLPVQRFAARWLEQSPPRAARTSLVHSDMGPGNFLFAGGHVTAILDWEVAHWGDPMEDLAAIAVRDMATPVGELATRYAEYAAEGGAAIDLAAVAWYRVFILTRNTTLIALGLRRDLAPASRAPLERFQLLLLRALALCFCDVVGVERPSADPTDRIDLAAAPDSRDPIEPVQAPTDSRALADRDAPASDAALARRFALEWQAQARRQAALLGPFIHRLPQRFVAP